MVRKFLHYKTNKKSNTEKGTTMAETKETLTDTQIEEVTGGAHRNANWKPYKNPDSPIVCLKCRSRDIWYIPGPWLFGSAANKYWCHDCNAKFYGRDIPAGGSDDW